MSASNPVTGLLDALHFAAERHRDQRRKGADRAPYVNHLIEVVDLLARVGGVEDVETLQAGALHDVLEDTEVTPEELETRFGGVVRRVVEEVTDDPELGSEERKQAQIDHAPHLSERAKLVKIADKISNIRAISETPPAGWSVERRRRYVVWGERVVAGVRGSNLPLERLFDHYSREALRGLRETPDAPPA